MWFITLCNNSNINKNIYGYGSYGVLSVYLSGVCAGGCFVCSPKPCSVVLIKFVCKYLLLSARIKFWNI